MLHQLAFSQPKLRQNLFSQSPEKLLFVNTTSGRLQAIFIHFSLGGFSLSQMTSSFCRPSETRRHMRTFEHLYPSAQIQITLLCYTADTHVSCISNMLNIVCVYQSKSLGPLLCPAMFLRYLSPASDESLGWLQG